ncbi:hypothetical protein PG994_005558 [Apiospora phragmitis]|uniref:Uncharacterized protein n=1 Tax=Apiospora phragmitis TaxID=2905665 RepID=A0ABR1VCJ7_9PEZI
MDQWWRKVSSKHSDYQRLAPDYFTYLNTNPPDCKEMNDIMLFNLQNDLTGRGITTFEHQGRTDRISGKTFYIRAQGNPKLYWASDNGEVFASETARTRFRIRIDGDQMGVVMIDDDFIIIEAATDSSKQIGAGDDGKVHLGGHSCRLRLRDLQTSFLAEVTSQNREPTVKKISGAGEAWELVD